MSSSSVRCEDPKGGSRGDIDSKPKPMQDETAGQHLKRSWSRAPPERADILICMSGERDREVRQKVAEEREAAPPGCLCCPNGKPQSGGRGG